MNANANSKRDNEDTYITLPVQTVSEFSVDTKEQMDNENFDSGVFVVENYEPNYNENKAIDSQMRESKTNYIKSSNLNRFSS